MVSTYKYLGCVVDEFLECSSMVEHRVQLGSQALSTWLRRCRESVGEVSGKSFMQLMKSLVDSVLLYGAEIWGCHRKLEGLSQIQLRALRIFFGVGVRHPKVSLMMEADAFPVVWLARIKCISFWFKVLSAPLYEGRILRAVALEALQHRMGWVRNLQRCLEHLGWGDVGVEAVHGLSGGEIWSMLENRATHLTQEDWNRELDTKPKLGTLHMLRMKGTESRCWQVTSKSYRRVMIMLRGGTAPFRVECGRCQGLQRQERTCCQCESGEVEDIFHWFLECNAYTTERQYLMQFLGCVVGNNEERSDEDSVALILDMACQHFSVMKGIMKMWTSRFQ